MGADMLAYSMWIREDKKPDWAAAEAAIKALRWGEDGDDLPPHAEEGVVFTQLEGEHENGPEAEAALQKVVGDHLALIKEGIENYGTRDGLRELAALNFGGWTVYVTGGLSWGDRPTELSETFDALEELEILDAAGFFGDSNAVEIRL